MNRKVSFIAAGVILFAAGFLLLPNLFARDANQDGGRLPQKWEYRVLPLTEIVGEGDEDEQAERTEAKFNELGNEGWEFCQIQLRIAVFKRQQN